MPTSGPTLQVVVTGLTMGYTPPTSTALPAPRSLFATGEAEAGRRVQGTSPSGLVLSLTVCTSNCDGSGSASPAYTSYLLSLFLQKAAAGDFLRSFASVINAGSGGAVVVSPVADIVSSSVFVVSTPGSPPASFSLVSVSPTPSASPSSRPAPSPPEVLGMPTLAFVFAVLAAVAWALCFCFGCWYWSLRDEDNKEDNLAREREDDELQAARLDREKARQEEEEALKSLRKLQAEGATENPDEDLALELEDDLRAKVLQVGDIDAELINSDRGQKIALAAASRTVSASVETHTMLASMTPREKPTPRVYAARYTD